MSLLVPANWDVDVARVLNFACVLNLLEGIYLALFRSVKERRTLTIFMKFIVGIL